MTSFKEFIRKLSTEQWRHDQDTKKKALRQQLKKEWVQKAMEDPDFNDVLIFDYNTIFPVVEQAALSNAGSPDTQDILTAAGINMAKLGLGF